MESNVYLCSAENVNVSGREGVGGLLGALLTNDYQYYYPDENENAKVSKDEFDMIWYTGKIC